MPEMMIGMNNRFYSMKGGNLYVHNENALRNNFYGTQYSSRIVTVINTSPIENKLFKTVSIEGDDSWSALMATDLQGSGVINKEWFEKKEASWFAFIRNSGSVPAQPSEYALRSINGIGRSSAVTGTGANVNISFPVSPTPITIGSIISVGDYLYYALAPNYNVPVLCGVVKSINVNYPAGINRLVVDTTTGGSVPPAQTPYFMYIKGAISESHGVLGHYCVYTLENNNTGKVELFVLSSEVMKSYP
jgi:hypothetical protein